MANTHLKRLIVTYRNDGLSYKEISEKTGIAENYARAVFSRAHRLDKNESSVIPDGACRCCGKLLQYTIKKKKKQFCCSECRDSYHNQRKSHKPYVLVCEYCGNEFVAYGNPKKRFCSRECQTLAGRAGE